MYQPQTEIIHVGIIRANSGAFTTVSMKLIELFLQYLSSDLMSNLWL